MIWVVDGTTDVPCRCRECVIYWSLHVGEAQFAIASFLIMTFMQATHNQAAF